MLREGFTIAPCTVEQLLRDLDLQGAVRDKPMRTTISDTAAPCPLEHLNRVFAAPAPNMLWLSDFTYVSPGAGFIYVAFITDAYARRSLASASPARHMRALCWMPWSRHERRPADRGGFVYYIAHLSLIRYF